MANIQVRAPVGQPKVIVLDRVPSPCEYIGAGTGPNSALFRVLSTVFTPEGGTIDAIVYVSRDPDGKPDELGFLPHFP